MSDSVEHPNHYIMPDGSEVISITRWLTSNAGQAVGYIARACRTDGVVKGNPVEDIRKAIFLLRDELDRLEPPKPTVQFSERWMFPQADWVRK